MRPGKVAAELSTMTHRISVKVLEDEGRVMV
jgi:hypothetical protein